jgi:hypothetical protein
MLEKPVILPVGRAKLSTSPAATGSNTPKKTIGTVRLAFFCGHRRRGCNCDDDIDLKSDKFFGQTGKKTGIRIRVPIIENYVLAIDVAKFSQSLAKRVQTRSIHSGSNRRQIAHSRHFFCRLLGE